MMKDTLLGQLPPDHPWRESLYCFDTLPSTNSYAKSLAMQGAPQGTMVIAGQQTQGRGRMGRSFHSPAGKGIYMSVILRPGCAPRELMHLTSAVGVAMCDAVEKVCHIRPGIKWINDLVLRQRKVGGILVELGFDAHGAVDYAIVGIGINCSHTPEDFPPELQELAASLSMVSGKYVSPADMGCAMIEAMETLSRNLLSRKNGIMEQYRADCITLGRQVRLMTGDQPQGIALDVTEDGSLLVRLEDGTVTAVSSGEVSVRGLYGYV